MEAVTDASAGWDDPRQDNHIYPCREIRLQAFQKNIPQTAIGERGLHSQVQVATATKQSPLIKVTVPYDVLVTPASFKESLLFV
jgi:hypothetical protein